MTEKPISPSKISNHSADPKGLIQEAYNIEGISEQDCRSIFFEWTFGTDVGNELSDLVNSLHQYYMDKYPSHPMTKILAEGALQPKIQSNQRRRRKTSE